MSEREDGRVAPVLVEGAQEFYRKRKRGYFRAAARGEMHYDVCRFLGDIAQKKMLAQLCDKLMGAVIEDIKKPHPFLSLLDQVGGENVNARTERRDFEYIGPAPGGHVAILTGPGSAASGKDSAGD